MTDRDPKSKGARTIAVWDARARAYGELVRRQPVFTELADRLLERLVRASGAVDGAAGGLIDLGAGTGLVSERALERSRPWRAADLALVDPAPAMLGVALERLRPLGVVKGQLHAGRAEELGDLVAARRVAPAACVVSSAALQLADLDAALEACARATLPGGHVAFNLWWHRVADDAQRHQPDAHWKPALARALAEFEEPPSLARGQRRTTDHEPVAVDALVAVARRVGFDVVHVERREATTPGAFFIDFAAMDDDFLVEVPQPTRADVLRRARELAPECTVGWREFLFERVHDESAP
ncbi:hypothetical protein Pla163_08330 [Planctomycetes bacterium Pla163]|uniref:Methyltransferase domain-containing protein n=1 Tax=Rohdeia mirabilis TaxID=2528008 RepID=A0A518CWX1_9BACT|nr:hypothetical protein Pla163_08330 [Planctomycetes bacterium Pla163]